MLDGVFSEFLNPHVARITPNDERSVSINALTRHMQHSVSVCGYRRM